MDDEIKMAVVYATFPDLETAERIGGALIKAELAGCINLLPGMTSIYRWEGEIERAHEVVMVVKTRANLTAAVTSEIEARHPYDTPAVLVFEVGGGARKYLEWIASETRGAEHPAAQKGDAG